MSRSLSLRALLPVSIAIAVACTSASADAASLTKVADFNPALGQLPESITSDGAGNLFMSMRNTVQRLTPGGVLSTYATLPVPSGVLAAGLKFDDEGDLFVATGSLHPDPPAAFIWRVDEVGAVSMHAELDPQGFPNDLAFDDHDNLFVTDPLQGRIWRVDADGEPTVWMEHPALEGDEEEPYLVLSHFGVDGIAFDKYKKWIYVSNLDYGTILRVKMKADGTAGPLEIYVDDFDALAGADGIAFDSGGNLYVAVNGQDRLVMIDPWRNVHVLAEGGLLDSPSALVFGGSGCHARDLYVTNFAITRAYGIKEGAPHPSLVKMSTWYPGLPL